MREHVAARFDVGARQVDLEREQPVRDGFEWTRRGRVLVGGASPDRCDHSRAGRFERGQIVFDPRVDAGTREADGVEHAAARRLGDAQRRIARPRERGNRLHGDRAEAARVAQMRDLGAVTEGPGRGDDRVGQADGPEVDRHVDGSAVPKTPTPTA